MTTLRKTPALSNNGGLKVNDDTYAEEVNANVVALWSRNACWLNSVAGTNTITASADAPLTALPTRPNSFILAPANANTGPVTLNIDSTGNLAITDINGVALGSGALQTATIYLIIYDGVKYRCFNPTSVSASIVAPTALFVDQKTQGTTGGSITAGSWVNRVLNTTIFNAIAGASLSAGDLTLPAGNFYVEWQAPGENCNNFMTRWFNVTGNSQVAQSDSGNNGTSNVNVYAAGRCKISPSSPTVYRIQQWNSNTATNGGGLASNITGMPEQYSSAKIWGPL